MQELAEAFPDEGWLQQHVDDSENEFEPEAWHELYFRAWDDLRFDRTYGAMGGETPIPFSALSAYASQIGITGGDLRLFVTFMSVLDTVHLERVAEASKTSSENQT